MFGDKSKKDLEALKRVVRRRIIDLRRIESLGKVLSPESRGRLRGRIEAYEEILDVLKGEVIILQPKN